MHRVIKGKSSSGAIARLITCQSQSCQAGAFERVAGLRHAVERGTNIIGRGDVDKKKRGNAWGGPGVGPGKLDTSTARHQN